MLKDVVRRHGLQFNPNLCDEGRNRIRLRVKNIRLKFSLPSMYKNWPRSSKWVTNVVGGGQSFRRRFVSHPLAKFLLSCLYIEISFFRLDKAPKLKKIYLPKILV